MKQEAAKKIVEAEFRKKKGGKGLSVLSGRDLYEYKRDLFKDDDDAEGVIERDPVLEDDQQEICGAGETEIIQSLADQVQSELFLDGDDEDLDELLDDSDVDADDDFDNDDDIDDGLEVDDDGLDEDEDDYLSNEAIHNLPN